MSNSAEYIIPVTMRRTLRSENVVKEREKGVGNGICLIIAIIVTVLVLLVA